MPKRLGILGGTFKPIHIGHLRTAEEAFESLRLDSFLFLPAAVPPHKTSRPILAFHHRWNLLNLAIAENPRFQALDLEYHLSGKSYTASTFGGTPIVSAAALEVCRVMEAEGILDHCRRVSTHFRSRLEWLKSRHAKIMDVRGMGLLLGIRLRVDGEPFVRQCMEKGFLINCVQGNILRFVPPLVIRVEEIDALIDCLDGILGA